MLHHSELGDVEGFGRHAVQDPSVDGGVHGRSAAQHPEGLAVRRAHDGVLVVFAELEDPVVTIEGPEKGDLELGVALEVDDLGFAVGDFEFAIERVFVAGVDDPDLAISQERVVGGDAFAAFFEPEFDGRDLVPLAQVAIDVDVLDGLELWKLLTLAQSMGFGGGQHRASAGHQS